MKRVLFPRVVDTWGLLLAFDAGYGRWLRLRDRVLSPDEVLHLTYDRPHAYGLSIDWVASSGIEVNLFSGESLVFGWVVEFPALPTSCVFWSLCLSPAFLV